MEIAALRRGVVIAHRKEIEAGLPGRRVKDLRRTARIRVIGMAVEIATIPPGAHAHRVGSRRRRG